MITQHQADDATAWAGDRIKTALDELAPSLLQGAEPEAAFKAQLLLADSQWLDPARPPEDAGRVRGPQRAVLVFPDLTRHHR